MMLFMVQMTVNVPVGVDQAAFDKLKAEEKRRAEELQRDHVWLHLWRVAGRYANVSIFDVPDAEMLHDIVSGLPLFPFMDMTVTALCRHPSAIVDQS
jgi:muconolactone D-isomerase